MEGTLLKTGQSLRSDLGTSCVVREFLGGGGQGEVYRSSWGGRDVALKWYFRAQATGEQAAALELLVARGAPDGRFLWPLDLVRHRDVGGFGYLMPLRHAALRSINDIMKRRAEPSFRALATAGFELADSFLNLHTRGLCYRDISFGNVFLDPDTGHVAICDNDNVAVNGTATTGVLGTPRFMAPEIVRGEASPSTSTDLFSLAVLLFYLFMMHHPLEGQRESAIRCLDLPAMNRLYGQEPLFVFDPRDPRNRPDPRYHQNALLFWPLYPGWFRELFERSFTEGLVDPLHGRVRESEWRSATLALRDSLVYCAACGAENAAEDPEHPLTCWSCGSRVSMPLRLELERKTVYLNSDTRIYPWHVRRDPSFDFSRPVGEVGQNPQHPRLCGLRNTSETPWVATFPDGTLRDVPPERSVRLSPGVRINFGESEGVLRGAPEAPGVSA